jgi:hypothetical protein
VYLGRRPLWGNASQARALRAARAGQCRATAEATLVCDDSIAGVAVRPIGVLPLAWGGMSRHTQCRLTGGLQPTIHALGSQIAVRKLATRAQLKETAAGSAHPARHRPNHPPASHRWRFVH